MKNKKILVGALIILLSLSGIIYVSYNEKVKLKVDYTKTEFYVKEKNWVISGIEYNKIIINNKEISPYKNITKINMILNNKTNETQIIRTQKFINNITIIDTYLFRGDITDVKFFPVSHEIKILNAKNLKYKYKLNKLSNVGETRTLFNITYFNFGKNMILELNPNYLITKINSKGTLETTYLINNNEEIYNIRFYDPVSMNLLINKVRQNVTVELGTILNITGTRTTSGPLCIDLLGPNYIKNYSCINNYNLSFLLNISYFKKYNFNDSTTNKNLTLFKNNTALYYQETANKTIGGSWFLLSSNPIAYNITAVPGNDGGYYNFTYKKPQYATKGSRLKVKYKNAATYYNFNLTINNSCWDYNNSFLFFSWFTGNGTLNGNIKCKNGTNNYLIMKSTQKNSYTTGGSTPPALYNKMYDGDYSTCVCPAGASGWRDLAICSELATVTPFCEEGIYWNISNVGNKTIGIKVNSLDDVLNFSFNVKTYNNSGQYPQGIKIYINNTLVGSYGEIIRNTNINITKFNNSLIKTQINLTNTMKTIAYIRIPKYATIRKAYFNITETVRISKKPCGINNTNYNWNVGKVNSTYCYVYIRPNEHNSKDTYANLIYQGTNYDDSQQLEVDGDTNENKTIFIYFNFTTPQKQINIKKINDVYLNFYTIGQGADSGFTRYVWSLSQKWNSSSITWLNRPTLLNLIALQPNDPVIGSFFNIQISSSYINYINSTSYYGFGITGKNVGSDGYDQYASSKTTNQSQKPALLVYYLPINDTINLTWVQVGVPNGTKYFNYTGDVWSGQKRTKELNKTIKNYLNSCQADVQGYCNVPIYVYSTNNVTINISGLFVNYVYNNSLIIINGSFIQNYANKSTGEVIVPIKISSITNSILEAYNPKLTYKGGMKNYSILLHPGNYSVNLSSRLNYTYSKYNKKLPYSFSNDIIFLPKTNNDKNLTPYGQTLIKPILNLTGKSYGKKFNFIIKINETISCINLSLFNQSNKSKSKLLNLTYKYYCNLSLPTDKCNIFMWADMNQCNATIKRFYNPQIIIRSCCDGCQYCTI